MSEHGRARKAVAKATELHREGYNCAESVLGGVLSQFPVEPLALRVATGFGGGVGRQGDVCGAVTGGVIALSWIRGRDRPDDRETYARCTRLVRRLLDGFREQHGTLICRELTGYDLRDPAAIESFAQDLSRSKLCARLVETAAALAVQALLEDAGGPPRDAWDGPPG